MSTEVNTTDLHVCMGLNSCANKGRSGNNDCAGKGDCATAIVHPCHTLNSCKGQGGCGIFGTTEEFARPGENDCKYQGSCGVPILNSRFIAQGPNKGLSVWALARSRFEAKMAAEGKIPGDPPLPYGPTNDYVSQISESFYDHSSCGQSGSRSCSYEADPSKRINHAQQRVFEISKKSKAKFEHSTNSSNSDNAS